MTESSEQGGYYVLQSPGCSTGNKDLEDSDRGTAAVWYFNGVGTAQGIKAARWVRPLEAGATFGDPGGERRRWDLPQVVQAARHPVDVDW